MNSRQDQTTRGGHGATALDTANGADRDQNAQPTSRRAAREAERRAAEALATGQAHPSGVVDFQSRDMRQEFDSGQAFEVQNTSDIWAALKRQSDEPEPPAQPPSADLARFHSGVPESPVGHRPTVGDSSAVSGELLDRVRGAVLGRERESHSAPAAGVRQPEPTALTRRELRSQQLAGAREDDLPADWFTQAAAVQPIAPAQPQVSPQHGPRGYADPNSYADPNLDPYADDDEAYYDAPYEPEPTVAIRALHPTELEPRSPMTAPVNLPQFFAEPTGDDALTFSSPVSAVAAEQRTESADPDPSFLEPRSPWGETGALSAHPAPLAAPSVLSGPELGPPSEVTDLAGFEALIRQARNTPAAPQRAQAPAPKPSLPWADDEDVQDGFTGLLSRSVQGSHGSSNALILPNDPQPDLTQAVNSTGDIFITGSMNLPRSLSTTGATADHYDSLDIDRIFDASQDEAQGVAPVRASSAISGTGANRALVTGRRAPSNILPTVLAIVAGAMAVGVVTLLVGSWVLNLF